MECPHNPHLILRTLLEVVITRADFPGQNAPAVSEGIGEQVLMGMQCGVFRNHFNRQDNELFVPVIIAYNS